MRSILRATKINVWKVILKGFWFHYFQCYWPAKQLQISEKDKKKKKVKNVKHEHTRDTKGLRKKEKKSSTKKIYEF